MTRKVKLAPPMNATQSPKGWKLTVSMEKNMTCVIKIN